MPFKKKNVWWRPVRAWTPSNSNNFADNKMLKCWRKNPQYSFSIRKIIDSFENRNDRFWHDYNVCCFASWTVSFPWDLLCPGVKTKILLPFYRITSIQQSHRPVDLKSQHCRWAQRRDTTDSSKQKKNSPENSVHQFREIKTQSFTRN